MIAQLKLKTKLVLLVLVTSVLLILQGGYGEVKMGEMADRIQAQLQAVKSETGAMVAIENAQSHFKTQVQEWKNILIRGDNSQSFDKYLAQFDQQEKKVQASLNSASGFMKEVGLSTDELEKLKKEHLALGDSYREALRHFNSTDVNAGKQIDVMVRGIDRATTEAMNTIVSVIEQQHDRRITAEIEQSKESYVASRNAFAIMVVLGLLLAVACATVILRDIMRQLGGEPAYAVQVSRRIAEGNLTVPVDIKPSDTSSLLASMGQMQNSLIDLVRQVHQVSGSLSSSAQQVHAATQHVAVGSEMQNEAAGSMAAAVEEVTVSISHVASNAQDARSMALDAGQFSEEGRQIVKQVISEITDVVNSFAQTTRQVEELGAQSEQISSIALVIKEIADQTNLLALNAAIEAARAGEQGRGFAVVADEVRKLAERTTKSTSEIAEMIASIQEGTRQAVEGMEAAGIEVEEAVDMAAKAGEAMSHIESSARQVLGVSTEISEALNEQSSASTLISQNVASISNMVEVNTSAVKEVVTATEHLEKLARELVASVDRFRVEPVG